MSKIRNKKSWYVLTAAALLFIVWMIWGNVTIGVRTIEVENTAVPEAFSDYRIAHVSDLHNAEFGKDNRRLLKVLRDNEPDVIAITGDLVHSSKDGMDTAMAFIEEAVKIAPCVFVTGNHESWISRDEYQQLERFLVEQGVYVLRDNGILIENGEAALKIVGIDDTSFAEDFSLEGIGAAMDAAELSKLKEENVYTILLSHRPEFFEAYCEAGMDLVLSGHAHGGQFRLPFVGGVLAPHQGLFPKYDSGLYTNGTTDMIVSRGVGNSLFPVRFNNRPEIIFVSL